MPPSRALGECASESPRRQGVVCREREPVKGQTSETARILIVTGGLECLKGCAGQG